MTLLSLPWPRLTCLTDSTYSTFNPTVFKTLQPNFSGLTYTVGGYFANNDAIPVSVYGSGYNFTSRIFAISHRGYFFVPVTGNYTISTNAVDDILLAWVGPNAYSGFTRQNAVLSNTWNANAATYTFSATAGQYVPIRFLLGQGYGGWGLSMMLLGPNNTNIITSGQSSTRWLVQYVCGKDKSIAPPYPPFGSET